ncbi:MAG: hypothetical protein NVS3B12_27810 [Acidimicrobiales bacterium]
MGMNQQIAIDFTVTPLPEKPHQPPQLPPALVTIVEAGRLLGVGRSTTYELIACGHLKVVHIGRAARVPVQAVPDLVARLRSGACVGLRP